MRPARTFAIVAIRVTFALTSTHAAAAPMETGLFHRTSEASIAEARPLPAVPTPNPLCGAHR